MNSMQEIKLDSQAMTEPENTEEVKKDEKEGLAGKRLLILGSGPKKEAFLELLAYMSSKEEKAFEVHTIWEEPREQDLVFLFASSDEEKMGEYLQLLDELLSKRPASVLLISDVKVYGRVFGARRALQEEDMGYVSPLTEADGEAFLLRLCENLAYRLYTEEGLPVKIARCSGGLQGEELSGQILKACRVLLYGENGEVYNLDEGETDGENSPLGALPLKMDIKKVRSLY